MGGPMQANADKDDEVLCECFHLTRGQVLETMRTHNITDPDVYYEVMDITPCGLCMDEVDMLIETLISTAPLHGSKEAAE
ncbi:MAG: hypothetical protein ACPGOY_10770 [Rhodospirillaceae bacterium]